ncbi:MBL fold metallo-hydrolase [Cryptosporangium aurantiacum]|uniref:L-ascorbate metabolism protein UlaG, beta-lactamase superfamily n=1 Tax=Cryptosporangium aurantiacum TaxID=134849 RepID=A0A1M7R529_9ACTN|nr:MBL fold metallo-hydrolase [Cryptosporangium aurantiacum]SHN40163.1 L-ascorbate metabolism protein UlaG, beta-lactamase superfamily [Cryptosporangium aurantiacum]
MKSSTRRGIAGAAAVAGVSAILWAARDVLGELGARPSGERAERVRRSPQYRGGAFRNRVPASVLSSGQALKMLREWAASRHRRHPAGSVPVVTTAAADVLSPDGLHVTWYGHSSALVEIEGCRVLFDPVWSERCSPSSLVGPRRLHPNPVPLAQLPRVDAVVISHDHYDHLDGPTVRGLVRLQEVPFLVPLGIGAHLERWGVPADRIVELDWDESVVVAGVRFTATEARHFSGRAFSRDNTLWASWVVAGAKRRVFYTGDTGYFPDFAAIGATHGPFDVTLMQVGAYGPSWPDIHMTPEEAVVAHRDVRGELLIPLHWATFNLALHDWAEPADRLWKEAKAREVRLAVPRPGERVDVDAPPQVDGWWQLLA